MPKVDYSKLLGRMKERGFTQKMLAAQIGISESHMSQKLNGTYVFKQTEMQDICRILEIDASEIGAYFFSPKSLET